MLANHTKEDKINLLILAVYTPLVLFFCSKMSPLYPINEWSDVNLYFNIAKAMSHGQTLYTETFDHKGPLIFFIYQLGYVVSNDSFLGIYFIQCFVWFIGLYYCYRIARFSLSPVYAFIATMLTSYFLLSNSDNGGSAEEFITMTMIVSIYYFVAYFKDSSSTTNFKTFFILGFASAFTLLIKINLTILWVFPLLALFVSIYKRFGAKKLFSSVLCFVIGALLLILPIVYYFSKNNALTEAWDIYINLNRKYARIDSPFLLFRNIAKRVFYLLLNNPLVFIFCFLGAFVYPFKYLADRIASAAMSLAFCFLIGVICMTFMYLPYYNIPLCVYCLLGAIVFLDFFRKKIVLKEALYIYSFVFILFLGINIYSKKLFDTDMKVLTRKEEPQGDMFVLSNLIHKEKDQSLFLTTLDANISIFTWLNLTPNVKYFVSPNLSYDIYPDIRNQQMRYIKEKKTNFIIIRKDGYNSSDFLNSQDLKQNYELIYSIPKE